MMRRGPRATAMIFTTLAFGGCSTSTAPDSVFEVRDSAGVEIIVSGIGHQQARDTVFLGSQPITIIHGPFSEIRGVEVLDSGGVVTADAFANEIRVYSPSGAILKYVGGDGDGPTEFRSPSLVRDMSDPSVLYAYDRQNKRVLRLDPVAGLLTPIGDLGPSRRVVEGSAPTGATHGKLVYQVTSFDEARFMSRDPGTFSVTQAVWSIDPTSNEQVLLAEHEVPLIARIERNGQAWDIPYAPRIATAAMRTGIAVVAPGLAEIELYHHGGRLNRIFRVAAQRTQVDGPALARWNAVRGPTEGAVAAPDSMPFFDRILVDDLDRIWARRYQVDPDERSTWLIFATEGRLEQVASVPGRFEIKSIREGYAAGVVLGEYDEERIAIYRLSDGPAD